MKPFSQLSAARQKRKIRQEAAHFAQDFGFNQAQIRLVYFGFNATYALQQPWGEKFALRVNLNSIHSRPEVLAEVALVQHLARCGILVATPKVAPGGQTVVSREIDGIPHSIHSVCYSWIHGKGIHDRTTAADARSMARLSQALHKATQDFHLPPGAEMRPVLDPLDGFPYRFDAVAHADHGAIREVLTRGQIVIDRLYAQQKPIPIHHDLHFSNVRRTKTGLAVFDFDDCRLGHPAQDIGVTMFYLRRTAYDPALEAAYRAEFEAWPGDLTEDDLETLMACRQVLLANDLIASITADLQAEVQQYVQTTNSRLHYFLRTGRFEPRAVT